MQDGSECREGVRGARDVPAAAGTSFGAAGFGRFDCPATRTEADTAFQAQDERASEGREEGGRRERERGTGKEAREREERRERNREEGEEGEVRKWDAESMNGNEGREDKRASRDRHLLKLGGIRVWRAIGRIVAWIRGVGG